MTITGVRLFLATIALLLFPILKLWMLPFSNQTSINLFAGFYPLFSGFAFWVLIYWYIGRFGWRLLWQQIFCELVFVIAVMAMLLYCYQLITFAGYQVTL